MVHLPAASEAKKKDKSPSEQEPKPQLILHDGPGETPEQPSRTSPACPLQEP